ncbi:EAL domain-containing protein [Motilimonas sp. 1_MG-2023]|uniref:putative bifunctional diguanylate cyclase/phosphodiesterase n=1 Tax=Motilimonas sp. 1_MG-2023 TaxID=3062672 RepID=UPI0026E3C072|nr:GGDEF and EAL domain-containing protein [Motilimonas sp. 1_MG-2023]MDO6526328.1 EAL domain-containing protein [Motilimonas sp. 1_MG-2023]
MNVKLDSHPTSISRYYLLVSCFLTVLVDTLVYYFFHNEISVLNLVIYSLFFNLLLVVYFNVKSLNSTITQLHNSKVQLERANRRLHIDVAALSDQTQKYQTLLNSLPDLAWVKDTKGRFLTVNAQFENAFGINYETLIGKTDFDLSHPADAKQYRQDDLQVMETGQQLRQEFFATAVDGSQSWIELIKVPVVKAGKVVGTAGTARDISERKRAQEKLAHLAHFDSLTGLANRYSLEQDLTKLLACEPSSLLVAFLDMDNFKLINDSMGHAAGDQALIATAKRLRQSAPADTQIYRLSGDEFVLVAQGVVGSEQIQRWSTAIMESVCQRCEIDSFEFDLAVTMGISLYPQHGMECWELVKNADIAMYQAKLAGRKRYQLFSEQFAGLALQQISMDKRLRQAIEEKQLFLRYQPMVNGLNGTILGMEALIRWQDPERGEISPAGFIPFAEQSGLISDIGKFVLEEALAQQAQWLALGLSCVPISINVSGLQFHQHDLVKDIAMRLGSSNVPGSLIELELTESILMKDEVKLYETLSQLRQLGLSLSVDDFGTGYSNLAYLSRFPISKLKIDRSFVDHIDQKPDQQIITRAIIELSKNLGLNVVAEGVERKLELEQVISLGCTTIQGYYFAKPLLAEEVAELLTQEAPYINDC